ncbi:MAG TPA: TonB-dependent receptor [Spongiibacteraceae bacterium]
MNNKVLLFIAVNAVSAGAYAADSGNYALEEVIVTAQKTEETIQSIPISIQALDSKALENNGINSFSDVKALIPSLKFAAYPTADQNLLITLRGIAPNALELTQDTPTAVHINGVYIARGNGLNMAVADLERIEVLRGPQGTLYGRNATAGAINMITEKPTDHFVFKQQVTVAERNEILTRTSINVPISDTLFSKLAYLYNDKDGYVSNSAPGGIDFGERNSQAARFDLRWQPTQDLTVDYGYDWGYQRYYSTPEQCLQVGDPALNHALAAAMDPSQCGSSFKNKLYYAGHSPKSNVAIDGHALNVEWELGKTTLRSITAYRTLNDKFYGVLLAGGPNLTAGTIDVNFPGVLALSADPDHTKQHQFSQELQLVGDVGDYINYNAGLYYFKESGTEKQGLSTQVVGYNVPGALFAQPSHPFVNAVVDRGPFDLDATNESKAIFGQLTITPPVLDNNFEIIPGIRYTRDSREATQYFRTRGVTVVDSATGQLALAIPGTDVIGSNGVPSKFNKDFSKTTPSLTMQYHINPDVLTYAKYVKGYKSGGTAAIATTDKFFVEGFGPETLTSIELGIKSSWLDQRLRVNADVFQSKFKDQQVSVASAQSSAPIPPVDVVNAGRSTYQGGELELQAALAEDLRISANYAYLHFAYDKVENQFLAPNQKIDVTDFFHNVVPTNTYSLSADYSPNIVDFAKFNFNLNYSYTDATGAYTDSYSYDAASGKAVKNASSFPKKYFITPSYGIWNTRVSFSEIQTGPGDKGSVSVALWCKNLADKKYISFQTGLGLSAASAYQGFWGEPRTLGLDLIYRYE